MTRYAHNTPNSRRRPQAQPDMPQGLGDLFRQFQQMPRQQGPMEGSGSGFIVSPDGYILTNNHVVEGADKVTVTLLDKRTFDAKVIGRDPTTDVAIVKIDAKNLPTLKLGDDRTAQIGSWALAIGNPFDLNFTVTAGIISAKGRQAPDLVHSQYDITDYIQTDAAINPGNSGGPLLNIKGEVIGINAAIESGTGSYAGYGFAVPITLAKQVMDDILKYGHVERAIIGVTIGPVGPGDAEAAGMNAIYGALVQSVSPDGPADKAGLQASDVITQVAGQRVDDQPTLQRIVRGFHPGDNIEVDVMRHGDAKSFHVKLGSAPAAETVASADDSGSSNAAPVSNDGTRDIGKLGITVQPVPADFASHNELSGAARHGLLVTDVSVRGPAYRNLFQGNDVIIGETYPSKRTIDSFSALQDAVSSVKPGGVLQLLAWDAQQRTTHVVSLVIPK
jgi:serine protease Do